MHPRERSHLEEWATLLGDDVSDELLEEESEAWLCDDRQEHTVPGDEAR